MTRGVTKARLWWAAAIGAAAFVCGGVAVWAQSEDGELRATEHIRIENPETLTTGKAARIYQSIAAELTTFYAMS